MNKPKLNEPDVEATTTTFNSTTGESITINKTIPSQQFKDIFVTGMSVEDQHSIVDFKQNHGELNLREYGHIKIEPNVITYNGKIYVAIDSLNPTFEEVKKEWEDDGFKFNKIFCYELINTKNDIRIYFDNEPTGIECSIEGYVTSKQLIRLIKTFRALEEKDEKEN